MRETVNIRFFMFMSSSTFYQDFTHIHTYKNVKSRETVSNYSIFHVRVFSFSDHCNAALRAFFTVYTV